MASSAARSISSPTYGAMTAAAAAGVARVGSIGGQRRPRRRHVQPAVGGEPGQQRVGEAELRRAPPGGDVAHATTSGADDAQEPAHPLDHVEVAQLAERWPGPPASCASWVMNTRRASSPRPSCSAARMLTPWRAKTPVTAWRTPGRSTTSSTRWYSAVVSSMARMRHPAEGAERAVGAELAVHGGVDEVAEHRARRRHATGTAAVEHQRADGVALDEDRVVAVAHAGQRVLRGEHRPGGRARRPRRSRGPARRWPAA